MFALNLDRETGRVLSATLAEFAVDGMPIVEALPEGDISDYLYRDGAFVYSPLPAVYPTAEKDAAPDEVFSVGADFYRARIGIARGEAVTRYNADPVSLIEIVNALQAQKGE